MKRAQWDDETISRLFTWLNSHGCDYFSQSSGKQVITYVKPFIKGSKTALDYGCGPGFLTEYLLKEGFNVAAMDFTEASVNETNVRCKAYKDFEGAYSYSELTKLDNKYDVIFILEVIEHLSDDYLEGLMDNMSRLLKDEGYLVITTPNEEKLDDGMIYCPFCDTEFHHVQHLRSWSAQTLTLFLEKHGFRVKHMNAITINEVHSFERKMINTARRIWRKKNGMQVSDVPPNLVCVAMKNS